MKVVVGFQDRVRGEIVWDGRQLHFTGPEADSVRRLAEWYDDGTMNPEQLLHLLTRRLNGRNWAELVPDDQPSRYALGDGPPIPGRKGPSDPFHPGAFGEGGQGFAYPGLVSEMMPEGLPLVDQPGQPRHRWDHPETFRQVGERWRYVEPGQGGSESPASPSSGGTSGAGASTTTAALPVAATKPHWQVEPPSPEHLFGKGARWYMDPLERGANDLAKVHLGDRTYYVKTPSLPADLDIEHAANQIQHLIGMPNTHALAVRKDRRGVRHLVSPQVPGERFQDIFRRITSGQGDPGIDPRMRQELQRLIRSVPTDQLGSINLGNWFLNGTDRHAGNYLYEEGNLYPIDYGISIFPHKNSLHSYYKTPQSIAENGYLDTHLLQVAGHSPEEVLRLPVSKEQLSRMVENRNAILDVLARQVLPHYPNSGAYSKNAVLDAYQRKFDRAANALEKREPVLGDLVNREALA